MQLEDVGICEDVQRGLASGAFDTGRFSVRREAAGYHFHQLLAAAPRGPAVVEAVRFVQASTESAHRYAAP